MINYFTKLNNRNIIVKDTRSNTLYSIYGTEWFSVYWHSDYWYESILNFFGIFPFVIIFEPKLNGKQPDLIPITRADFCKYMEIVIYDK